MTEYDSVLYSRDGRVYEPPEALRPIIDDSPFLKDKFYEYDPIHPGISPSSSPVFKDRSNISLAEANMFKEAESIRFEPMMMYFRYLLERARLTESDKADLKRQQANASARARHAFLKVPRGVSPSQWAHTIRNAVAEYFPEVYEKFVKMSIHGLDGNNDESQVNLLADLLAKNIFSDMYDEMFDMELERLNGLPMFAVDDQGMGSLEHEYNKAMFEAYKQGVFGERSPEEVDLTEEKTFMGIGGYKWVKRKDKPPAGWKQVKSTTSKSFARAIAKEYDKRGWGVIIHGKKSGRRIGRFRVWVEKAAPKIKVKKPKKGFNLGNAFKALTKKTMGGAKYIAQKTGKGVKWAFDKAKGGMAWITKRIKDLTTAIPKYIKAKLDCAYAIKKTDPKIRKARATKDRAAAKFTKIDAMIKQKTMSYLEDPMVTSILLNDYAAPADQRRKVIRKCKRGKLRKYKGKWVCQVTSGRRIKQSYIQKFQAKKRNFQKDLLKYNQNLKDYNKGLKDFKMKSKEGDSAAKDGKAEIRKLQGQQAKATSGLQQVVRNNIFTLHGEASPCSYNTAGIQLGFVCLGACIAAIIAAIIIISAMMSRLNGSTGGPGFPENERDFIDSEPIWPEEDDWEPVENFEDPYEDYEYYPEEEITPPPVPRAPPRPPPVTPPPYAPPRPPPEPPAEEEEEEYYEPEYVEEPDEAYEYYEPEYDEDFFEEDEYEAVYD